MSMAASGETPQVEQGSAPAETESIKQQQKEAAAASTIGGKKTGSEMDNARASEAGTDDLMSLREWFLKTACETRHEHMAALGFVDKGATLVQDLLQMLNKSDKELKSQSDDKVAEIRTAATGQDADASLAPTERVDGEGSLEFCVNQLVERHLVAIFPTVWKDPHETNVIKATTSASAQQQQQQQQDMDLFVTVDLAASAAAVDVAPADDEAFECLDRWCMCVFQRGFLEGDGPVVIEETVDQDKGVVGETVDQDNGNDNLRQFSVRLLNQLERAVTVAYRKQSAALVQDEEKETAATTTGLPPAMERLTAKDMHTILARRERFQMIPLPAEFTVGADGRDDDARSNSISSLVVMPLWLLSQLFWKTFVSGSVGWTGILNAQIKTALMSLSLKEKKDDGNNSSGAAEAVHDEPEPKAPSSAVRIPTAATAATTTTSTEVNGPEKEAPKPPPTTAVGTESPKAHTQSQTQFPPGTPNSSGGQSNGSGSSHTSDQQVGNDTTNSIGQVAAASSNNNNSNGQAANSSSNGSGAQTGANSNNNNNNNGQPGSPKKRKKKKKNKKNKSRANMNDKTSVDTTAQPDPSNASPATTKEETRIPNEQQRNAAAVGGGMATGGGVKETTPAAVPNISKGKAAPAVAKHNNRASTAGGRAGTKGSAVAPEPLVSRIVSDDAVSLSTSAAGAATTEEESTASADFPLPHRHKGGRAKSDASSTDPKHHQQRTNSQQQHQQHHHNHHHNHNHHHHNDSEWETVSTRSRGRKNSKSSHQNHNHHNNNHHSNNSNHNNHNHSNTNDSSSNQGSRSGNISGSSANLQQQGNHKTTNAQPNSNTNTGGSGNAKNHRGSNHSHHHSFRRKNNAPRKIVREILFSVLDGVDDEVRSKDHQQPEQQSAAAHQPPALAPQHSSSNNNNNNNSWRGLDASELNNNKFAAASVPTKKATQQNQTSSRNKPNHNHNKGGRHRPNRSIDSDSDKRLATEGSSPRPNIAAGATASRSSGLGSPPADQSTAPTYQETASGLSSTSNTLENVGAAKGGKQESNNIPAFHPQTAVKSSDGVGSVEDGADLVVQPLSGLLGNTTPLSPGRQHAAVRSPAPPLPTLLSPENANSTASSVASSLEAPHGRQYHHHGHHPPSQDEHNAVGYHLLDVCDRLSNDMALFMKSRAQAVSIRRSERAVLMGALQEVVSGIWPNSCQVELYGSCATSLDLPSSDLDVVVVGLDHRSSGVFAWNSAAESYTPSASTSRRSSSHKKVENGSAAEDNGYQMQRPPPPPPPSTPSTPAYMPVYSENAHRVMRLSSEIERLPWAVKVKSIPNATVPVIKILADPSKISGFSSATNNDWQGYGGSSPADPSFVASSVTSSGTPTNSNASASSRVFQQPWRGSDVMNGLISLDITFQGPEHGGIGSTEYSAHVVNQVCQETGLMNPEDTPFVQCLMVLKELLAQRKLNEPYSGGLSSYALLLLLTALMRERAAIREEIERVEQHRQTVMAAAVVPPPLTGGSQEDTTTTNTNYSASNNSSSNNARRNFATAAKTDREASSQRGGAGNDSTAKGSIDTEDGRRTPLAKGTSTAASWASVARNTESTVASSESAAAVVGADAPPPRQVWNSEPQTQEERKPISFADVVGKSQGNTGTVVSTPKPGNTGTAVLTPKPTVTDPATTNNAWASSSSQQSVPHSTGSSSWQPAKSKKDRKGKQRQQQQQQQHLQHHQHPQQQQHQPQHQQQHQQQHLPQNPQQQQHQQPQHTRTNDSQPHSNNTGGNNNENDNYWGDPHSSLPMHQLDPNAIPAFFPQGFDDVIEVLCLGETTSGKLLMHFLLHYGQYFEATTTAIDISGKHERVLTPHSTPYSYLTPYIERSAPESIDLVTGMLVVDHIVIYDPLEGAEKHNVGRRCFAWPQVRWIFAQSYATLSSAVEKSSSSPTQGTAFPPAGGSMSHYNFNPAHHQQNYNQYQHMMTAAAHGHRHSVTGKESPESDMISGDLADPSSPLLRCLLSF